jgi:hypothetical protein
MRRWLLLLPLLLFLLPSQAQGQVYIQNDILLNQNGQPIPLATVTVCNLNATGIPCTALATTVFTDVTGLTPLNQTLNPIQTDGQGNYQFFVGPGNYTVTFSRVGYSGKTVNFSFPCVPNSTVTACGSTGGSPGIGPAGTIQATNGSGVLTSSGEVDNGTTLTVNRDVQSKGPNPWFDITRFGAYASSSSPTTTTGTINAGTNSLLVTSASTFLVGQGIEINGAGPATTLATPNTPTVSPVNILGGATTYNYKIVAEDFTNGLTAASVTGTTTVGQSSLGTVTQTVTSGTRVAGITTYTTSATHNIQVGAAIEVGGFSSGSGLNGDFTVATVPSGTTFTVYQPTANGNATQTASAAVSVSACNKLSWNTQTSGGLTTVLRYLIYRNNVLVGTSVGIDAYYLDCGFNETGFPSYYPTSPQAFTIAGNLSSTIVSIGGVLGTTITLADNASTNVGAALVQHDNWPAVKQAYQAAITEGGGTIYIPTSQSAGGFFVFNSPINLPTIASSGIAVGFVQAGRVQFNQPFITTTGMLWDGQSKTDRRIADGSGSNNINQIDGNAQPLIYMPGNQGDIHFNGVFFNCNNVLQSCVTIDTDTSGFGDSGILFENFQFSGNSSSEAKLTQKGGFNLEFNRGRCSQNSASFGVGPCIRQTEASAAVGTGMAIAGNLVMRSVGFVGSGYQLDQIPGQAAINNQTWMAENITSANLLTPLFNIGWPTQAFSINNISGFGSKDGTPLVDTTLANVNSFSAGGIASVAISNFNYNGRPFFAGPITTSVQTSLKNTDRTFFTQPAPTNFTAVPGAGGSVPPGFQLYSVTTTDFEGNESLPVATASVGVFTNQNVALSCTAPSETTNLQFYNFYRFDPANSVYKQVVGGFNLATCNATDSSASFGPAATNQLGAAQTSLDSNGLMTWKLRFGQLTITAPGITAPRSWSFPNSSSVFAGINVPETFTDHQSISNGKELRFFSTDLAHWAGFKGGSSTSNLVWALPTTDSTGTQCLSSNGSLQLSFSPCSGGTGTPGGANTQVQFNNSGTFGGSSNLTWVSPVLTIGVATSTTGQLALTGATSGTVTITPQATAGTPTLTLPNTTGTFADGASAPLVESATTGNLTCPTCTTNAAALTNNQIVLGAGGQATQIGPAGTTTTVLHGNAAGAPTYAAVNLANDTTGTTAIANGGTGQTTASTAFNALAPATGAGGLIVGTGTNTYGNLSIGGNGLCLVSNGATPTWNSCAAGAVSGSAVAGQGTFWTASSGIGGSVNWLYSSGSGHSIIQGANGTDVIYAKRATDSTSTGNFLHFQNAAAGADIAKLDVNGNLTVSNSITISNTTVAGNINLGQGTTPSLVPNAITLTAPTAVSASGEEFIFPSTASTGFIRWTNASNVLTGAFAPASGIGACVNTVVTATNDNTAPTCNPVTGPMFGTQSANQVWASPNGSSGNMTVRSLVSADVPPINLNLGGNGGITGTLPIGNGGTNATAPLAAFNNLSPLTTAGDILYGGTSGSGTRLAAGTATQLLHSGSTPSWSAVSLTADVTGTLPLANGGTNASSGLANTNGAVYSDGTKLVSTATGGAGTLCLTSASGGTPTWGSCSGSAATAWSALTAPSADLSLSMTTFNSLFTHGVMTGTRNAWEITDGNSTSTGSLFNLHTGTTSTMKPFKFTAQGTANGIQMDSTGSVTAIGTGGITATSSTQSISTTSPLGGGGTFSGNLTLTCATCVTSGSSLTNNAVVVGSGGGQGTASVAVGTSGQILQTKGSGSTPAFIDFPDYHYFPAADCVNAVAASGWSTGSTPAATCRAGTNNKEGFLTWGASDTGQMSIGLPADWDTATNPNVRLRLASTDATNGHTVIMQIATACSKGDGSTTDDVAFNTAQSLGTITLNGNANRQWDATLTGITMTGCVAGGVLRLQLSRTTDTATNVEIYGLGITIPRLLTVQAN